MCAMVNQVVTVSFSKVCMCVCVCVCTWERLKEFVKKLFKLLDIKCTSIRTTVLFALGA